MSLDTLQHLHLGSVVLCIFPFLIALKRPAELSVRFRLPLSILSLLEQLKVLLLQTLYLALELLFSA